MNYQKNAIKFGINSVNAAGKESDSNPVYNNKYLRAKIK